MSIMDDILSILKGANPDADPAALQAQATQLAQHPDATTAMQPISGPPPSAPTPPATSPSSFDVGVSDNTVTQNGSPASVGAVSNGSTLLPVDQSPTPPVAPPSTATPPVPAAVTPPISTPKVPPTLPPVTPPAMSSGNDEATRKAGQAAAEGAKTRSGIGGLIAGLGDATNSGLAAFGINNPKDVQSKILEKGGAEADKMKAETETKISDDPNSDASKTARSLILQIAPQMAKDPNFNSMSDKMIRDKVPLVDTMIKARASEDARKLGLAQTKANKDLSLSLRQDQQQDKLEQNAKQMVSNLRGDKSLARTEEQRDAAAVAYNRLSEIQKSGKEPNPVDYADILGQIYKARTGTAPGEQIMRDIQQHTAAGSLGKAYTAITGQQAPATTKSITDSLKNMAESMGKQADQFHDGYMKAHLIKPMGLDDERWQPILQTGRGLSFGEATKLHQAAAGQSTGNSPSPVKGSDNDPMGIR